MKDRTREHNLFIVRQLPRPYPVTAHQEKFKQVLQECGVVKGMSRDDLVKAMIECIPKAWQKLKGG